MTGLLTPAIEGEGVAESESRPHQGGVYGGGQETCGIRIYIMQKGKILNFNKGKFSSEGVNLFFAKTAQRLG